MRSHPQVYIESYSSFPDRGSRFLVILMAVVYYCAWTAYPIFFALGPEGFKIISYYYVSQGHELTDKCCANESKRGLAWDRKQPVATQCSDSGSGPYLCGGSIM